MSRALAEPVAADPPSHGLTYEERDALRRAIDAAKRGERENPLSGKTRRRLGTDELAVLRLLAEGFSSKETAAARGCSVYAVDRLRGRIQFKLGARNGAHAVAIAFRSGLLE